MIVHDNLEEFADPENYDRQDRSDTGIAFYKSLARQTGGPVLELACGTGRVTIPIAQAGFDITGLDIVPGMIRRARSKSAGPFPRWIVSDARNFRLSEVFHLIFLTGNAFQSFLTNEDQASLLQCVYAHLHYNGLFAFETRNPLLPGSETPKGLFVTLETAEKEQRWPSYIDKEGREVDVSRTRVYDHVAQILHWKTYHRWREGSQECEKVTRIALRYTFPQELASLLSCNGFRIVRQYGNWDKEPLRATSPSIIVVCKKTTHQPRFLDNS